MNAAARELTQMESASKSEKQEYVGFIDGYKQYKAKKSKTLSKLKLVKVMGMSRATDQLTDDGVYSILYLYKVEKFTTLELTVQFPASEAAIKAVVEGKSRKNCYEKFMIVESLLNR